MVVSDTKASGNIFDKKSDDNSVNTNTGKYYELCKVRVYDMMLIFIQILIMKMLLRKRQLSRHLMT